jgi:hypothetical protein
LGGLAAILLITSGSGTAIFLGTLLDSIPESRVLGAGLTLGGSVSFAFVPRFLSEDYNDGTL